MTARQTTSNRILLTPKLAVEYSLIDTLIEKILAMPPIGSSMQADYKNGKPMEVDIILGYPVRKALELGISIPITQTIYTILSAVNLRVTQEAAQKQ